MLQIMEGVSTWQPGQGWQFKLKYDEQFAAQYPLVVKQHSDQWRQFHNKYVIVDHLSLILPKSHHIMLHSIYLPSEFGIILS